MILKEGVNVANANFYASHVFGASLLSSMLHVRSTSDCCHQGLAIRVATIVGNLWK